MAQTSTLCKERRRYSSRPTKPATAVRPKQSNTQMAREHLLRGLQYFLCLGAFWLGVVKESIAVTVTETASIISNDPMIHHALKSFRDYVARIFENGKGVGREADPNDVNRKKLGKHILKVIEKRRHTIACYKNLLKQLRNVSKSCRSANVAGSSVGVASAILGAAASVGALAAGPVGWVAIVGWVGLGVGVAGTSLKVGTSIAEYVIDHQVLEKLRKCSIEDEAAVKELVVVVEHLDKQFVKTLPDLASLGLNLYKFGTSIPKFAPTSAGLSAGSTAIPKGSEEVAKTAAQSCASISDDAVQAVATAGAKVGTEIADDVAGAGAKLSVGVADDLVGSTRMTCGKFLSEATKYGGCAISVAMVPVSAYQLVNDCIALHKDKPSKAAESVEKVLQGLQEQLDSWEEFIHVLQ